MAIVNRSAQRLDSRTPRPGPALPRPAAAETWLPSTALDLDAYATWTLPVALQRDCSGHAAVAVALHVESLTTEGGDLTLMLQSSPAACAQDCGWQDLATVDDVDATGVHLLCASRATERPMGLLRLAITASGAAVSARIRAEILLKEPVASQGEVWVESLYLKLGESESVCMDAFDWRDASEFAEAFVLCEFVADAGSWGGDLTVSLQTAPTLAMADGAPWAEVDSTLMSDRFEILAGKVDGTNPPMGPLRLKWSAAPGDPLAGTFRAWLLLKN
jgi:hypothetical protein